FFEQNVKPIFANNCLECHGNDPDDLGGPLALISRKSILQGGDSGPAIDLENHADSLLLDAVNYENYEMPPSGNLPKEQLEILPKWVQIVCRWTAESANNPVEPTKHVPEVNAETKSFWSFQQVVRPDLLEDK